MRITSGYRVEILKLHKPLERTLKVCRDGGAGKACPARGEDAWSEDNTSDEIRWWGKWTEVEVRGPCHSKGWFRVGMWGTQTRETGKRLR